MFKTAEPVKYPADPDEVTWNYTPGTELRDPSGKELGDYYARLVNWYVNGGFTDELGQRHESGHRFKIAYWEVLNEPDFEHETTPEQYTARYDAIVARHSRGGAGNQVRRDLRGRAVQQSAHVRVFSRPRGITGRAYRSI